MGYELQAVVGSRFVVRAALAQSSLPAVQVLLEQGFALVPMTDQLHDAVGGDPLAEPPLGFWKLPAGFDATLATWSAEGPIAYVEADFFGGIGSHVDQPRRART
jgi:hypothetical protein